MSVPAYFIPARETVDIPNVADAFSENLVVGGYGRWYPVQPPYQSLSIDIVNKVMRNGAFHVGRGFDQGWHNAPATTNAFFFAFDAPIDLSDLQYISFLMHTFDRHYDNESFSVAILIGQNAVSFNDANGIAVYSPFFTTATNVKAWSPIEADNPHQFQKSDFTGSASFDWTKVVSITFYVGIRAIDPTDVFPPSGYDIWIDGGPFMVVQGATLPLIQILAEDVSGAPINQKSAQWYNYNNNTNQPITIPMTLRPTAGNYGVMAKDWDFVRWSDGSPAPLKNFTVSSSPLTLTAVYGVQGIDLTTIALIGGAIALGGGVLYYLRRK